LKVEGTALEFVLDAIKKTKETTVNSKNKNEKKKKKKQTEE